MSIQQRLTLFTALLVLVLSSLMGGSMVRQNYDASVEAVTVEIETIATAVSSSESDKVTTALTLIQEAGDPLSLFLLDDSDQATPIRESESVPVPESVILSDLETDSVTRFGSTLVSVVLLEADSRLLIAGSIQRAIDQRSENLIFLTLSLIAITTISLVVLRIVISRDIDRERQVIERDERLRVESAKRESLLEFAGDASHELRTPLTVIKGYLELLQKQRDDSDISDPLKRMLKETQRMEATLDQLLQFVAIEAAPIDSPETIELSTFIRDSLDRFSLISPSRRIKASLNPELVVQADRNNLNRVVDNILMNVHRHTNETDPVDIITFREDSFAVFEIHDGGPGIPHLINGAQMRPFKRFDPSRSRETGGSGLGMSIVDSSVRKLGGQLTVGKSRLGGLMVRVALPLRANPRFTDTHSESLP